MVPALILLLAASASFEDSFRAGLLALGRNELPAAAAGLEDAAKLAPSNGRVWVALSQTYWKLHRNSDAADAAGKAFSLAPDDPAVLQSLAIYYAESGQQVRAAETQEAYAAKVPRDAAARDKAVVLYFEAAQPFLNAQKFAEAIQILEPARKRLPNSAQLELAFGVACYGVRRFHDAAAAFLQTIAIAPEIDQPYLFLGEFLDQVPNRLPEISAAFAAYQKMHPDDYRSYLLRARALDVASVEPVEAERFLRKALAINSDQPAVHLELAGLLDRMGRYPDAALEYEKTVALKPSDAAAHYRLARDYDRIGKHDAAVAQRAVHAKLIEAQAAVQ